MKETLVKLQVPERAAHELKEYAAAVLYLYVCFGAMQLFKDASLRAAGINYAPYGVAVVKALILGKFMAVGHALRIGEYDAAKPLIYPILHKSLSFVALLFVLDLLEEVGVGALHGRSVTDSFFAMAGGTGLQIVAACILLFLVLLPYFTYREVGRSLGEGTLWRMLFFGNPIEQTAGELRLPGNSRR